MITTFIIPAASTPLAQQLSEALAGPAAADMYSVPLYTQETVTHYGASGVIDQQFADVLPRTIITVDEEGNEVITTRPANVQAILAIAEQLEVPLTEEELNAALVGADISGQGPYEALARLGLTMTATPVPADDPVTDETIN